MSKAYAIEEIKERVEKAGIHAEITTANKNGVEKTGIRFGEGDVQPIIYVMEFEPAISDDNIDEFIEFVKESIDEGERKSMDMKLVVNDFDYAKNKMRICLGRTSDDSISTDVVSREFLDMTQYVRVMLVDGLSLKVTKNILENWGISEDELFDAALKNITYGVKDLRSMLAQMIGMDEEEIPETGLKIITCRDGLFWASGICDTDVLDKVADDIDSDNIIVIPSSVHEVLVTEANDDINMLKEMVCEINGNCVKPEDQLSDNVYMYSKVTKELKMAWCRIIQNV